MKYHRHLLLTSVQALEAIFFEDRHADKCIEYYLRSNKKWGSRDRRFFAETVYDCVRWWNLYWYLVDETPQRECFSIINASLWRRDLPQPDFEPFEPIEISFTERLQSLKDPALIHAFPEWLFNKLKKDMGPLWLEQLAFYNKPNSLVLRTNTTKITPTELKNKLFELEIEAELLDGTETGLIIKERANVFSTPLFKNGFFEVQDGSSQQVAPYLDIQPGMRVIDACAGAGGKTLHIADILKNKGKVISMDIHQWKLDQLKLRARRNTYSNIEMKLIDNLKATKRLKDSADRLLLDVPCSGLGVLRRNPDTKWKLTEESMKELLDQQKNILNNYSTMLKPGGLMVYSTCSILPSENTEQVQKFLELNPQFNLLKEKSIYPIRDGYDGFYMALIKKN